MILARIASGDDEAMAALYRRHGTTLYRLGLRLLRDEGMAEEMVQDTFVRVWRGASRFDPRRASGRTYIVMIAHGSAAELRRRTASRPLEVGTAEEIEHHSGAEPDEPLEQLLLGMAVGDALDTLSDAHGQVLRLYYEEDLTQRQIAERLELPLGTVKTRTFHALRALRVALEERAVV